MADFTSITLSGCPLTLLNCTRFRFNLSLNKVASCPVFSSGTNTVSNWLSSSAKLLGSRLILEMDVRDLAAFF